MAKIYLIYASLPPVQQKQFVGESTEYLRKPQSPWQDEQKVFLSQRQLVNTRRDDYDFKCKWEI